MSWPKHKFLICPSCRSLLARRDLRRKQGQQVIPQMGASLQQGKGQAPALRCKCGHTLVLLGTAL